MLGRLIISFDHAEVAFYERRNDLIITSPRPEVPNMPQSLVFTRYVAEPPRSKIHHKNPAGSMSWVERQFLGSVRIKMERTPSFAYFLGIGMARGNVRGNLIGIV
jgi:hypothetical protein